MKTSSFLNTLHQEEGKLYFIRPISFKPAKSDFTFTPDFTYFHGTKNKEQLVTVNFSIDGPAPVKKMHAVSFQSGNKELAIARTFKRFFVEKVKGNTWRSRYSTQIPYAVLSQLLDINKSIQITSRFDEEELIIRQNKKWIKMQEVVAPSLAAEVGNQH